MINLYVLSFCRDLRRMKVKQLSRWQVKELGKIESANSLS